MSLRDYTLITIEQQTNSAYPTRGGKGVSQTFLMDFVNSGEIVNSWQNLTDTAKIKIPRNIYVNNETSNPLNFGSDPNKVGLNLYGGTATPPLFMRGDKIKIKLGFYYNNFDGTESLEVNEVFSGYITKIKNRVPIEIDCEDEMWKLKQINVVNKVWLASTYDVVSMLKEMLAGTGITVIDGLEGSIKTNIGDFRTQNETVGAVLARLKTAGLYSYFRNNELRCSGIVYYPGDRTGDVTDVLGNKGTIFGFQENIINDSLEYQRKEDLNIAIRASCETGGAGSGTNKDGTPKTKRQRFEVMVGKDGAMTDIKKNAYSGDVIALPILGCKTLAELTQRAIEYLPKFYYTGFKGSFTTFGQPFMRHGDACILRDKMLPERDGTYLIKQVVTTFGMGGFRQKIMLHIRIDSGYTIQQINAGL